MKPIFFIICALLIAVPSVAGDEVPEDLLGLHSDFISGQVFVEVVSGGCTTKDDFRSSFSDDTLTLFRIRQDDCKALPHKITIAFTLEELGINPHQPFSLANRIVVNEGMMRH